VKKKSIKETNLERKNTKENFAHTYSYNQQANKPSKKPWASAYLFSKF